MENENLLSESSAIINEERKSEDLTDNSQDNSEYNKRLYKKRLKYAIFNTIATIFHKLTFSVISNVPFLSIYYISHLYHSNNEDKDIKVSSSVTLSPIYVLCQYTIIWLGGPIQQKIGIRFTVILGGVLLNAGALGLIFFKSLIMYQIMMALFGFGMGIAEAITLANSCKFLPGKKLINFWNS